MNTGSITERVYHALKQQIISSQLRPGARLYPNTLASALDTSATPVRDALYRLAAEHMVEDRPHEGFRVSMLSEGGLRDLYMWNADVLMIALRQHTPTTPSSKEDAWRAEIIDLPDHVIALRTAALFGRIAEIAGSVEIEREIHSTNDRLGAVRGTEAMIVEDCAAELSAMADALAESAISTLRKQVRAYHQRRVGLVSEIVRIFSRSSGV